MPRARLSMPRNPPSQPTRIPAILRTRDRKLGPAGEKVVNGMPRLWNAKRRIKVNKGLTPPQHKHYLQHPKSTTWRQHVSPDVAAFIDTARDRGIPLESKQKAFLLRKPAEYFSRPHRVPLEQRKQVYFPDFSVTLMRTPHNPPAFASFQVPLSFSKLDLKDYLLSLYGVKVVHIRSYVQPHNTERRDPLRPGSQGMLFRPKAKKKMTVQLEEPFVWPDEVTDFEEWEKDEYWRIGKAQVDMQRMEGQWAKLNPNRRHRKSVADQARELLQGKREWKPTWQSIPTDERVLKGIADVKPALKPFPQLPERQPLRRIPMERRRTVPSIETPVREMAELRV